MQAAGLQATILRASAIHGRAERRLPLIAGAGDAPVQPIAAADVAACVLAALDRPGVHELAGPQTMRWRTLRPARIDRPPAAARPAAAPRARAPRLRDARRPRRAAHLGRGPAATVEMTTPRGTRDAEALGVTPRPLTGR